MREIKRKRKKKKKKKNIKVSKIFNFGNLKNPLRKQVISFFVFPDSGGDAPIL